MRRPHRRRRPGVPAGLSVRLDAGVDRDEAETFRGELKYLLVHQQAAFNSPVWFNIGVQGVPKQSSACFILAVEDTMDAILNWYREEGIIFKGGSGSGINLSGLRSSEEGLQGGGTASGPVSFMRGADASAGTIKSGGKTRRAAKMVILNADHPDVEEFIWCKAIEERKAQRTAAKIEAAKAMTFGACAEAYIEAHAAGWRNPKSRKQWQSSLREYVFPAFGDLPVQAVDVGLVLKAIEPIWNAKSETASRVRGRIEAVLDWATARGYRPRGENPALWKGHLENILPKRSKIRAVVHHAALPYAEIGAFMAELRQQEGIPARALEFAILTAAPSSAITS